MHRSTRGAAAATLAFSAALLISGCSSSSTGGSAAAAPTTSAAAPGGGAGSTSSASASTSASTSASAPASAGAPSASGGASGSCQNLQATDAVKTAVISAYEAKFSNLNHLQTVPGSFYYGSCGGAQYAVANFMPTAGASIDVQVALQDDGSTRKYFSYASATGWSYIASNTFPDRGGCAAQIPTQLAAAWSNCPAPH
jgi:hypothetical protein